MDRTRGIAAVLFLLGSLAAAKSAIAYENPFPPAMRSNPSSSWETSQEVNVLRRVATALAAGSDAMQALRGSPIADDNRDKLQPAIPGMECGIDRILNSVSCYGAALDNKIEAEAVFSGLMDDMQAALPPGSWRAVKAVSDTGSVRSISYQDQKSNARIDIDLMVTLDTHPLYFLRVFGWIGF